MSWSAPTVTLERDLVDDVVRDLRDMLEPIDIARDKNESESKYAILDELEHKVLTLADRIERAVCDAP